MKSPLNRTFSVAYLYNKSRLMSYFCVQLLRSICTIYVLYNTDTPIVIQLMLQFIKNVNIIYIFLLFSYVDTACIEKINLFRMSRQPPARKL